jgi:glycosyltransferase involved in cell wall biosynthesis
MRVLILADSLFAARERTLLSRLELGLADEGLVVIQAVPETVKNSIGQDVFARGITYNPQTLPLLKGLAVRTIVKALAAVDRLDEPNDIDIVHVFGGSTWQLGRDLARELDAGLALECWRYGLAAKTSEFDLDPSDRVLYIAPDVLIQQQLLKRQPSQRVRVAQWGVLASDSRVILAEDRAVSFMLAGTGRDQAAFAAALTGMAPVLKATEGSLVFCDATAARRAELWQVARKLGILGQLSLIDDLEGRRDLLLQGDVLVIPEAAGEQRGIILEAMANALLVVAAKDPQVSLLQEAGIARLVEARVASAWESAFGETVTDRTASRAMGMRAFAFVSEKRRASSHVQAVLQAYDALLEQASV